MMIHQIRSTLTGVLTILIGVPLFTVFQMNSLGEISALHPWADAWTIITHTFFNVCMIAVGWIFFKSPFAGKLTEIVQSVTATSPSGAVKQTDTKVTVQEPEVGKSGGTVTTTVTGLGAPVTVETEQKVEQKK